MKRFFSSPAILTAFLLSIFLAAPAAQADEPVTILEADAYVHLDFFMSFSPTPVYWRYWDYDVADGPVIDAELLTTEDLVPWGYKVHCGIDGLTGGTCWADIEPEDDYFWSISAGSWLTCLIQVNTAIGLVADAAATGDFSGLYEVDTQTVKVTYPDGAVAVIIDAESGINHAEVLLTPGQYGITILTNQLQRGEQDDVDCNVTVAFVDAALPAETAAFSRVKALFR